MNWVDAHLPILPVLLPSATAILLLLIGDHGGDDAAHGHHKLLWARRIALGVGAAGAAAVGAAGATTPPAARCAPTWWANGRRPTASPSSSTGWVR